MVQLTNFFLFFADIFFVAIFAPDTVLESGNCEKSKESYFEKLIKLMNINNNLFLVDVTGIFLGLPRPL